MERSPPNFSSEDEEAQHYLGLLRDGTPEQKIAARERLAPIFERRGLLDEAAECYETNIRAGVRDRETYERLAAVYRRQGREELADEVLAEAHKLPAEPVLVAAPVQRRPRSYAPLIISLVVLLLLVLALLAWLNRDLLAGFVGGPSAPTAVPTLPSTPFAIVASPSPSPSPIADASPSPSPSPSPAPSPAAQRARVVNTEGQGANLRERPSATAERVRSLQDGTVVDIIGPDQTVEGTVWRPVRESTTGATGWLAADFLETVSP